MKQYRCLPRSSVSQGLYSLSVIQPEHIEAVRNWRNSQMSVLRQNTPISQESQELYFRNNVWPAMDLAAPSQVLFSFFSDDMLIGYGGLVHISWRDRRAEVSFLLNPSRVECHSVYRSDFLGFLDLISEIAFQDLELNKLFTETFSHRAFHISVLEEFGFGLEGVLRKHVFIDNQYFNSLMHGYFRTNES